MKSFKKIALAMVAAMTMSTLVATSASAAPMEITSVKKGSIVAGVNTWTATTLGVSATAPITLSVPSDNSVDASDVVEFVAKVDTGTSVSVVATNAFVISAIATPTAPVTASSGATTWTQNVGTGINATFYVYTKTTAVGSVAITNGGTTTTYYVQGTSTLMDKIVLSGVDSAPAGTSVTVTATAQDVFGNKISGKVLTGLLNGATLSTTATPTTGSGLTDFGTAEFKFVAPTTGPVTIVVYTAAENMATAVTGFSTPSSSAVKVIAVADLSAQVTALTTQLAAANAALAAEKAAHDATKVAAAKAAADALAAKTASDKSIADLKAAFNALAKKWNAKNPKAKVTLVK